MKDVVVIIGASPNPDRYSHIATLLCLQKGIHVVPLGVKKGTIGDLEIITEKIPIDNVHTVSLYIGEDKQKEWYDYIFSLNPKRIIFNPGTYNPELEKLSRERNIECVIDCTLSLLHLGSFF
jgi:predicted CoA-binding protein